MNNYSVYSNTIHGATYRIMLEPFGEWSPLRHLRQLAKKYPNIKNIYYGWGDVYTTDKPDFAVLYPFYVLRDVWKHINLLPAGYYMVCADSQRILNIYHRRWLSNPKWIYVESGWLTETKPYLILKKV